MEYFWLILFTIQTICFVALAIGFAFYYHKTVIDLSVLIKSNSTHEAIETRREFLYSNPEKDEEAPHLLELEEMP